MKKFFLILSASFLIFDNVFAACSQNGLDWNWSWKSNKSRIEISFNNTVNQNFWISAIRLESRSGKTIKSKNVNIHIAPYGGADTNSNFVGMRGQNRINTSNINTSSVKQVTLVCQTVSQSYVDNWKLSKIRKKMDNYLETNSGYEFKFWQQGNSRMHKRELYLLSNEVWEKKLLSP